jgi:uncharacterized glyoxalase superfamily protein PhnB
MPADPLDQLRLPVVPLEPRPEFADRLRRRLVAELSDLLTTRLPEEEPAMSTDTSVAAPTITVALVYDDAREAIRWMVDLLEFEVAELHEAPDGTVAHSRLSWRTGNVFVADRHPGPWSETGPSTVCLAAESAAEIDRLYAKAQDAGADIFDDLHDAPYGSHQFGLRDPGGNLWAVGTYRPPVGPE